MLISLFLAGLYVEHILDIFSMYSENVAFLFIIVDFSYDSIKCITRIIASISMNLEIVGKIPMCLN